MDKVIVLPKNLSIEELTSKKDLAQNIVDLIRSKNKVGVFINRRKIKMQKIYYNLLREALNYSKGAREISIESTYRGFLTNYNSNKFIELDLAIIILTKKHSDRERSIIKELIESKTPTIVISLCKEFYNPEVFLYLVHDTRGLYHLMYLITLIRNSVTYSEFAKDYQITTKKLDFEELRTELIKQDLTSEAL